MKDLDFLLEKVKDRPTMHLGHADINSLYAFLSGFSIAKIQLNAEIMKEEKHFGDSTFRYSI
ncbi:MAG: hypothetical protein OEZ34_02755 [Spirochaetia bacterium]|nr:hypothetical protein [Spirochaetia bacterium]